MNQDDCTVTHLYLTILTCYSPDTYVLFVLLLQQTYFSDAMICFLPLLML